MFGVLEKNGIEYLSISGKIFHCPFKTRLPEMEVGYITKTHQKTNLKGFVAQECNSMCPLFYKDNEKNTVTVFCGCAPVERQVIKQENDNTGLKVVAP